MVYAISPYLHILSLTQRQSSIIWGTNYYDITHVRANQSEFINWIENLIFQRCVRIEEYEVAILWLKFYYQAGISRFGVKFRSLFGDFGRKGISFVGRKKIDWYVSIGQIFWVLLKGFSILEMF